MMKEAWAGYVKCAWASPDFKPMYCAGEGGHTYLHVWDAMPTLWLMGLHDEFNYARKWVPQMDPSPNGRKRHTFLGAMLSCFALTGDKLFLDSAIKFALDYVNVQHDSTQVLLDWADTLLELSYLIHLTDNQTFRKNVQVVEKKVEKFVDFVSHDPSQFNDLFFFVNGDYLMIQVKRYLQSNQTEQSKIEQFNRHIEKLKRVQLLNTTKSGLWYFGIENHYCPLHSGEKSFFAHLCGIGASLALNAQVLPKVLYNATSWRQLNVDQLKNVITHWEMAKNITDTCYWASKYTSDYMIPYKDSCYRLKVDAPTIAETILRDDDSEPAFDLQSFKILESYFTLWKMTGEGRYRDYAWEMANKIYKYARSPNGYINGLVSQVKVTGGDRDLQPPRFYTTLMYLYLIFTPDSYLPLDKWVLNSLGHPLPICGHNPAYPNVKC